MILNHPLVFRTQTVPGGPNLLNSAGFGTTWWVNSSTGSTSGAVTWYADWEPLSADGNLV